MTAEELAKSIGISRRALFKGIKAGLYPPLPWTPEQFRQVVNGRMKRNLK